MVFPGLRYAAAHAGGDHREGRGARSAGGLGLRDAGGRSGAPHLRDVAS